MRKKIFGRKFKRTKNQRTALFRSLISSMILNGQIKTTEAKAKAIKGDVEKMVTKAKKKGEQAYRDLFKKVPNEIVVKRLISEIAPKFEKRDGGYTRILRLERRTKDNAPMVLLQWVEVVESTSIPEIREKKLSEKKTLAKKSIKKTKKTEKTEEKKKNETPKKVAPKKQVKPKK